MAGASKANEEEFANMTPMKGKGCTTCNNKGYKGRVALYQVMPVTEDMRLAILRGASADELRKMTIAQGVKTIRMSGITKVCQGITTLKEVEGVSIVE
jgi:type IV pilus assembly protein PilB